jgi:hypothetical protein
VVGGVQANGTEDAGPTGSVIASVAEAAVGGGRSGGRPPINGAVLRQKWILSEVELEQIREHLLAGSFAEVRNAGVVQQM